MVKSETTITSKQLADKVLNRNFTYFVDEINNTPAPILTVDDFFNLFDDLFYLIPKEGEKSQRYILEKVASYLEVQFVDETYEALLEEITQLRELSTISIEKIGN